MFAFVLGRSPGLLPDPGAGAGLTVPVSSLVRATALFSDQRSFHPPPTLGATFVTDTWGEGVSSPSLGG